MAYVLSSEKRLAVVNQLVNGSSIRATERITRVHRDTICRLVVTVGNQCAEMMKVRLRNLTLTHLECDEIWTFCQKKQARLTVEERASRSDIGDIYVWTAVDQPTKLIPAFVVGKRSGDNARKMMMDLASRLSLPKPHASDDQSYRRPGYRPVIQISSDAFAAYPEAVDLAFGAHVKFGTIVKDYRNALLPYDPSEMVGSQRRPVYGMHENEARSICTSHVERNNLTIRTFMKRFTRLALGFSKKFENLQAAVAMHMAYYNFCWRPGKMRVTPAMAAGVTTTLWSLEQLVNEAGRLS